VVRRTWAAVGVLGGTLLALAPLKNSYLDLGFPDWTYRTFFWSSLLIFAGLIICWLLCKLGEYLERDVVEEFQCATRDEIQSVLPFYDRVIGPGQRPSVNELKAMFLANKSIFRFYKRKSVRGSKRIVEVRGFCTVIPMKADAANLLRQGELNGLKMDRTHIATTKERFGACYIGSIGAESRDAKAAVLSYILGVVEQFAQQGCTRAYTRPTTQDGLRIAKKYDFISVSGGEIAIGDLCYKEIGEEPPPRRMRKTNALVQAIAEPVAA